MVLLVSDSVSDSVIDSVSDSVSDSASDSGVVWSVSGVVLSVWSGFVWV